MGFAIESRRIAAALLAAGTAAVLIWFGSGLFPTWPLLWFAPLPVLIYAARSSWWAAGLTATAAWVAGNLTFWRYYTHALHLPLAFRMEILIAPALIFALAVLLHRALLRRGASWSALVVFPAAWVSFEYIFNLTSPHGTAESLSYSQLGFLPFLQLASITGPWGMSFLLLGFSSSLAVGIHLRKTAPMRAMRIVAATLGVIAAVLVFGAVRLALPPPPGHLVKVGLVASDLPDYASVTAPGAKTDEMLRDYAAHAEALIAQGAQVVVLPEHLGAVDGPGTATMDGIFQTLADKTGATIVVGIGHESPLPKYNQARVYTPTAPVESYNKHHLLPPYELRFAPGTELLTLPEAKGMWGVAICKDMDFTQLSRQYGREGAGLMLVPAWDFVLDRFYHGHMAVMRAVESSFNLARAARGGYLTVADNRGRILGETQSNSAPFATLLVDVPTVHDGTLYQRFGDWFAWVVLAVLIFTLVRLVALRGRHE